MTNPIDITPAGIAKALEGVTDGPWKVECIKGSTNLVVGNGEVTMCDETYYPWVPHNNRDWDFIAYARNALPLIAAHITELEAVIDSAEIRNGLTDNGSMWRFWSKKAREALDMQAVARAEGYRAGVEDAANRITASIQMLKNLGMTENAEAFVAAAEDIRALLNGEADTALQTKEDA
jgi:hypothetical protein